MNEVDFYDKDQTDDLLAGKVSGSGTIGTDLKPIIIVNGVAVAVANPLVDTASNQDNISGRKTFTPDNGAVTLVGTGSGSAHPVFAVRMTSLPDGADPSGGIWGGLQYLNNASKEVGSVTFNRSTNGDSYIHIFVKNSNNLNTGFKVFKTLAGDNYVTSPSRTYNPANTTDVVTQGSLAQNPEVLHATGNQSASANIDWSGTHNFNAYVYSPHPFGAGEKIVSQSAADLTEWYKAYEYTYSGASSYGDFAVTLLVSYLRRSADDANADAIGILTTSFRSNRQVFKWMLAGEDLDPARFKLTGKYDSVADRTTITIWVKVDNAINRWGFIKLMGTNLTSFTDVWTASTDGTAYAEPTTPDYDYVKTSTIMTLRTS